MKSPGKKEAYDENISEEDGTETGKPLKFVLSEEGILVREILLEELAKGLDAAWRLGLDGAFRNAKDSLISYLNTNFKISNIVFGIPILSEDSDREQVMMI